jgi:hypothetical protein
MGFDRLSNFIIKNLNYNYGFVIDELKRKVLGNHILFDLNFIIYNQMFNLEEEINSIIKIVLNLPFSYSKNNKTQEKLQEIFDLPWWKKHCENIEFIFDGDNEDEIINKLINFINTKQDNNLSKIDLMLIEKILIITDNTIEKYNIIKNIQTIGFFIDGIPSFSKILEQRRRRTKNYFESISRKKKFNEYFGEIKNNYMEEDGIKYNYFRWIEKRFSLDKSLSPIAPLVKKLESELLKYYSYKYKSVKIFINPGEINGESDIKIFQFIHKEKLQGDVLIHTTDSDLIHLMLVQQTFFNLKRVDINISILRHNSKDEDYIQYFDGPAMLNSLIKYYNEISRNESVDYRIIYDFCLLLLFFGNDHLPASFEIGPEIGLETIFKLHSKIKQPIISLVNDKIDFNMVSFKQLLEEFQKNIKSYFTKILINRHFKLLPNITSFLVDNDKLHLDYYDILNLLKHILMYSGKKIEDKLDENDIRFKLIQENKDFNFDNYIDKIMVGKNEQIRTQFISFIPQILDCLDFSVYDTFGLVSYSKPFLKTKDNYQDLYNILSENTVTELYSKNKVLYEPLKEDYLNLQNSTYNYDMCYSYVKKIYHLATSFFGNLSEYHTNNITAYSYDLIPKIEFLIKYLNENNNLEKIMKDIMNDNLNEKEYFNSINHHIFITAYLSLDDIKDSNLKNTTKQLNVNNLWIGQKNIETFFHNKVPALEFLTNWDNITKEKAIPNILNPSDYNLM